MPIEFLGKADIKLTDDLDWLVATRWSTLQPAIIGGLIIGTWFFVNEQFFVNGNLKAAIVSGLFGFFLVFSITVFMSLVAQIFRFSRLTASQRRIQWRINEQYLELADANESKLEIPWSQIDTIQQKRTGLLVHQKPKCFRWIPNRLFTEEERAQIIKMPTQKIA